MNEVFEELRAAAVSAWHRRWLVLGVAPLLPLVLPVAHLVDGVIILGNDKLPITKALA